MRPIQIGTIIPCIRVPHAHRSPFCFVGTRYQICDGVRDLHPAIQLAVNFSETAASICMALSYACVTCACTRIELAATRFSVMYCCSY